MTPLAASIEASSAAPSRGRRKSVWRDRLRSDPLAFLAGAMAVGGLAGLLPVSWQVWGLVAVGVGLALAAVGVARRKSRKVWSWLTALILLAVPLQASVTRYQMTRAISVAWADGAAVEVNVGPLEELRPVGRRSAGWLAEAPLVDGSAGRIRLRFRQEQPPPEVASRLVLRGEFRRTDGPRNPGELDSGWYDRLSGVVGEVQVREIVTVGEPRGWVGRLHLWWRGAVRDRLGAGMTQGTESTLLLASLLLGDTEPGLSAVRQDFQRTGTTHHLAVSGTHVAIVAGTALLLLRAAGILPVVGMFFSPRRCLLGVLLVVTLYGAAVTPGPAVYRAVLLAALTTLGLSVGRRIAPVNLLGACGVVLLVLDPLTVFLPGFQLTFGVLWAVLVPGRRLVGLVYESRDADVAVVDLWKPDTPAARFRRWRRRMLQAVVVGGVAWAASSLLVAHHFWQFNPYASAASLLLTPSVTIALVAGCAKVVLSAVLPWADPLWAAVATLGADQLRGAVHLLAGIPGSSLGSPALPGWAAVGGLVVLAIPVVWPGGTLRRRWAVWTAVLVITAITPLVPRATVHRAPGLTATLLSLDGGRAMALQVDEAPLIWIDAGTRGRLPGEVTYRRTIDAFLAQANERRPGVAIITTPGDATSGTLQAMVDAGALERVYGASSAESLPQSLRIAGLTVDTIHPGPGDAPGDGLVLRLTYAGKTIIYCGRLTDAGLRSLLSRPAAVRCDLLVLPITRHDLQRLDRLIETSGAGLVLSSGEAAGDLAVPIVSSAQRAVVLWITPGGVVTLKPYDASAR